MQKLKLTKSNRSILMCLIISCCFAIVSVALAILSHALAHNSPYIGIIALGLLVPSIAVGSIFGLSGALTVNTFVVVFIVQFISAIVMCMLISPARSRWVLSQTNSGKVSAQNKGAKSKNSNHS